MIDRVKDLRSLRLATILLLIAVVPAALPAQEIPAASPEDVGMSSERLAEIDSLMQKHIDAGEIQGAITVVARRGKVVHFKTHGLMDVERGRAMEEDAIFRMASSSKPVLGVAAMMMIEEGKFKPSDEVAKYLPEFANMQVAVLKEPQDQDISPETVWDDIPEHRLVKAHRPITIHDLLTHTAGLGTHGLGMAVAKMSKMSRSGGTLEEGVLQYAKMPLDFQPGTLWAYSPGFGLDVVSRIIEVVSEMPYDEFVRKRITGPLDMNDTHFFLPPEMEARRVVIHGLDGKTKGWDKPSRYVSASGGLSSKARDFLHFEQMLANGGTLFGKRIISPESVATMTSNQVGTLFGKGDKVAGSGFGYTVRVLLDPAAAKSARGKGAFGWGGAFGTVSWTDPEQEITAVLMVQQPTKDVGYEFEKAIRQAIVD